MTKYIVLLLALLTASPAWAGPEMLLMAPTAPPPDTYIFTANPVPPWTLGANTAWDSVNSIVITGFNEYKSFSHSTIVHRSGTVSVEYYITASGTPYYNTLTLGGVTASSPTLNAWATTSAVVTGGTGLTVSWIGDAGTSMKIRKVIVPKP